VVGIPEKRRKNSEVGRGRGGGLIEVSGKTSTYWKVPEIHVKGEAHSFRKKGTVSRTVKSNYLGRPSWRIKTSKEEGLIPVGMVIGEEFEEAG